MRLRASLVSLLAISLLHAGCEGKKPSLVGPPDTNIGPTGPINQLSIALSPDGRTIAGASGSPDIELWSYGIGTLIRRLSAPTSAVWAVAFSPDGNYLYSAGDDSLVRVWDFQNGVSVAALSGHTGPIYSLAVSPGGQYIISGGYREIIIWRTSDNTRVRRLGGHSDIVGGLTVTADGSYLLSASNDRTVKVWSLPEGLLVRTFAAHRTPVPSVAVSPIVTSGPQYVVSGGFEARGIIWRLDTGMPVDTLDDEVTSFAITPPTPQGTLTLEGAQYVITGGTHDQRKLTIWRLSDGSLVRTIPGQQWSPRAIAVSPNARTFLVAGNPAGTMEIWSLTDPAHIRTVGFSK